MDNSIAQPESLALPLPDELMRLMARPGPIIAHPAWREARDKILGLVHGEAPLVALLGPAGTGKTALLRDVADTIGPSRSVTFASEFSDMSSELPADGVVLVDEAERLSSASLAMLLGRPGITIIMTALPSFYGRLIEFRTGVVVSLPPLTDQEASSFLSAWMDEFGLPVDCLTPDAWERLIAQCCGVPRLLVSLLKLALFVGADESAPRVRLEHVETAIAVQGGSAETNLAAISGVADQDGVHDAAVDRPATPEDELDIPVPHLAPLVSEARASAPDEPLVHRVRTGGWIIACALCLAALVLALVWGHRWHRNDRTMLAQTGAVETPAPPVPAQKPITEAPPPTTPAQPQTDAGDVAAQAATPVANPAPPPLPQPTAPATVPPPAPATAATNPASPSKDTPSAPAAAPARLPSDASIRIVVTYSRGDMTALQRSKDLIRTLRADGFTVSNPFPISQRTSQPGIRYYFSEDEAVAGAIAARLGHDYGSPERVKFSARDGLPRPGTIEVDAAHE